MTWKDYQAWHDSLPSDWKKLEEWRVEKWARTQTTQLMAFADTAAFVDASIVIQDAATAIIGPALDQAKSALRPILEAAMGPQFDQPRWSPAVDLASQAVRQFNNIFEHQTLDPTSAGVTASAERLVAATEEFRDGITNNLRHAFNVVAQAIAIHRATDLGELVKEMQALRDQVEDNAKVALLRSEEVNRKTDKLLSEAVLTAEARWLDKTQEAFARQSDAWLAGIVLSAALLLVVLTFFILSKPELLHGGESWTVASNLAHFGPRVALVSLLSTLVLVCVREYRAARHNHVVYLHRATTVSTVKALTKDGESRLNEAILTLAAQSVFMPAATGFDTSGSVGPPAISPWLSDLRKPTDAGE